MKASKSVVENIFMSVMGGLAGEARIRVRVREEIMMEELQLEEV